MTVSKVDGTQAIARAMGLLRCVCRARAEGIGLTALTRETGMSKAQLFANKPLLTKILTYHVINGAAPVYAKDVKPGNVTMLSKDTLMVTTQGKLMDENGRTANILKTDIAASNGVVHVIDRVLMPK